MAVSLFGLTPDRGEEEGLIFVGDDWAEDHHDMELIDETGVTLVRRRLPEGVAGVATLHELIAEHAEDPEAVAVGIETDRGLWVASLVAAGYQVFAVNPLAAAHYRERQNGTRSGATSRRFWAPPGKTGLARSGARSVGRSGSALRDYPSRAPRERAF
jgi:hypothetical protein